MAPYDIGAAIARIEDILLASLSRNLHRHAGEEDDYGFRWDMWQAEQMTSLQKWSKNNLNTHAAAFTAINDAVIQQLQNANRNGEYHEEIRMLQAGLQADSQFFDVPDGKMQSLLTAVRQDLSKAEHGILRRADDMYRQGIFDAQVYLQSGSGSMKQAVDMAVRDLNAKGIQSVVYKNGRQVPASVYARMSLRTANERAQLLGEGKARDRFGVHTVIVPRSGVCCQQCAQWMCKVLVDDVYCSGTAQEADELGFPLLSKAMEQGFLHPQCNCSPQTYFPDSPIPEMTEAQRQKAVENYKLTQQQRHNEAQIRKYKRMQKSTTDPAKKKEYGARVTDWQKRNQQLCKTHSDVLRRDSSREKVWDEEVTPKQVVKELPAEPQVKKSEAPVQIVPETKPPAVMENTAKVVDKSQESGIIKSIDVDDYELVTHGKNIAQEVNDAILNTMKQCERDGGFIISEISTTVSPTTVHGTPVLQIEPLPNGLLKFNINSEYLSGKTLDEVDAAFADTDSTVVNSLEEAVIHESGHAISINGKTASDVKALYDKLLNLGKIGVSKIALEDGAECLAELEVLRHRGVKVTKELSDFYEEYMGRKYL